MSVQKYGVEFLKIYPGILKITEQVLNIAVLIAASVCGFQTSIILLYINLLYAICTTTFFIIVRYRSVFKNTTFPWDWIECANCMAIALMYALGSSIALSELTKEFIVTAILGYIAAMVYALETIDNFKLASTPRARYVWTTPNMPE